MKRMLLAILFAATLLVPMTSQAEHVTRLIDHSQVSFSASPDRTLDPAKVREAIVDVAKTHGWVASAEGPGKLTLSNTIRGTFKVVVNVIYSASGMQVDYVSSENLHYRGNSDVAYIHPKYNKWVNLLLLETKARLSD